MNLAEVMKQATVTLTAGDYLVANTDSVGYLPTYKDTSSLNRGKYMFKIVSGGAAGKFNIIPVYTSLDGNTVEQDTENPIIQVEAGKVSYVTTRNDPTYKDVYRAPAVHVKTGITAGQEARHAIAAFVAFADSEYSLGAQHFQLEDQDYLDKTP